MTSNFSNAKNHDVKRVDLHQQVTDRIIRQLEAGTVPWLRPWKGDDVQLPGMPLNAVTGKKYRGVNIVLLWGTSIEQQYTSDQWATFRQWQDQQQLIRKGEKGTMIVYYDVMEKMVDDELVKIPFLKSSIVFNRCQLQGYEPAEKPVHEQLSLVEKIDTVDAFIDNTHVTVKHGASGAYYHRIEDAIHMPDPQQFIHTENCTATEGYYSVLLHELTHWTGAPQRLNRVKGKKFGDTTYAGEELVAELGAAFLCAEFDITTADKSNHPGYIDYWLQVLRNDKQCLLTAASQASKAVDYLNEIQPANAPA